MRDIKRQRQPTARRNAENLQIENASSSLRIVREAFPMLAHGETPGTPESGLGQ